MTPYDDRGTSRRSVSPSRDTLSPVATVFLSSRRIVRNAPVSVRHPSSTHHSARACRIFQNRDEKNRLRTKDVKGISAGSTESFVSASCQYWGRRRYGPAPEDFHLA